MARQPSSEVVDFIKPNTAPAPSSVVQDFSPRSAIGNVASLIGMSQDKLWDHDYGNDVTIVDLEDRPDLKKHSDIRGYVAPAKSVYDMQQMSYYSLMSVLQAGGRVPLSAAYSGVLANMDIPLYGADRQLAGVEQESIVDLARANGELMRQALVMKAEAAGEFPYLKGVKGAFAFFVRDNRDGGHHRDHPLYRTMKDGQVHYDSEYKDAGDWALFDVITDRDATDYNAYINYPWTFDADGMPIPGVTDELLSEKALDFDAELRNKYGNNYPHFMTGFIDSIGRYWEDITAGKTDWDDALNDLKRGKGARLAADSKLNRDIHDELETFIKCSEDPFAWRILPRARYQLLEVQAFKNAPVPSHLRTKEAKAVRAKSIADRINGIFMEVSQGMSMAQELKEIRSKTPHIELNPARAKFNSMDPFNIEFARSLATLGNNEYGNFGNVGEMIAQEYGNLPPDVKFVVQPTPDNNVRRGFKSQNLSTGAYVYQGVPIDASAPYGVFPDEVVESFYDIHKQSQLKGVLGRFAVQGPGMAGAREILILDLLETQGAVLEYLSDKGWFRGNRRTLEAHPSLGRLLKHQPYTNEDVAIAERTPQGLKVRKLIPENTALHLIRNANGQKVRAETASIEKFYDLARRTGEMAISSSRDDRDALRGLYGVAPPELAKNETWLGSIAVKNNKLHLRQPHAYDKAPADFVLKPNRVGRTPRDQYRKYKKSS